MRKTVTITASDGTTTTIRRPKENTSALERRTRGERILHTVIAVILTLHCCSLFIPWIWTFLSALKESFEFSNGNPFALPKKWLFSNFVDAFRNLKVGNTTFLGMIWNSVWYIVLHCVPAIFVPACTGYTISKYRFRGRNFIYSTAILCMTLPIVGTMASSFKLHYALHTYDTPFLVILGALGGFGGTFLIYYGYFKNISWSYAEAVMIDGGGPFVIFFRIMLPQAMPLLTTYMITTAISAWNDYMTFVTYLPSWPNLATGLFQYQSSQIRGANYPVYFAGALISLIPTIVIFMAFSGKIMTSLSIGGLKG